MSCRGLQSLISRLLHQSARTLRSAPPVSSPSGAAPSAAGASNIEQLLEFIRCPLSKEPLRCDIALTLVNGRPLRNSPCVMSLPRIGT